jgi:hypothetical protein
MADVGISKAWQCCVVQRHRVCAVLLTWEKFMEQVLLMSASSQAWQ